MQGGLVSAILYMSIIFTIVFIGLNQWIKGYEDGRLLTFLGTITLFGGVGNPVITMSRVNLIFWVLVLLIFALRSARILGGNKPKNM